MEPTQVRSAIDAPPVSNRAHRLIRGSLLVRNTVWNLAGQIAPMAVGLIAIPRLIHALGTERFGMLTIAWMVVGYFSLFDLGLGRAVTNLIAQKLASGRDDELPAVVWTGNLLMGALGILGAFVLAVSSPFLVSQLLKTPSGLHAEALGSFYILSLSVPFVVSTAGFRGVLEGRQQFGITNLVRIPMGVATFAAPLLVLPWSNKLTTVVGILVAARFLFWLAFACLALRGLPSLRRNIVIDVRLIPSLFRFGAWMTLSNIISPLMQYMDRFLIGVLLSLTSVAYYATTYEVATKLLVVSGAIVGVLFPAFSSTLVMEHQLAASLFRNAVKYTGFALFPLSLLVVLFASNGLTIWLGSTFADHSTFVLQWIAIGVFANGVAAIPFAMIQGAGRADITAKLHLVELPFYLIAVWYLTRHFGINGTAIAWTLRVIVDCALLFAAVDSLLGRLIRPRSAALAILLTVSAFVVASMHWGVSMKFAVLALEAIGFVTAAWLFLLGPAERSLFHTRIVSFVSRRQIEFR